MSCNIHADYPGRLVVRYMCPHHLPIRPYACAMAFCPCFCLRCLVIYMRQVLAGLWYDICVPHLPILQYACAMAFCPCFCLRCLVIYTRTILAGLWYDICVHTHAQWRFVLVFAVIYTWQSCGTIYVSPPRAVTQLSVTGLPSYPKTFQVFALPLSFFFCI